MNGKEKPCEKRVHLLLFTFWNKYSSQTTGDVSIQDDAMIIIGIDVFLTESKEFLKSSQAEAPIVRAAESRKSSIWKRTSIPWPLTELTVMWHLVWNFWRAFKRIFYYFHTVIGEVFFY